MGFIGKQPSKAAITSSDITDGIVTADKLASDSVTTAKIADNGVTTAKIADTAVTTAKITDANITTAKIAGDAVTDAKVADDVIGTEHLTAGEVDTTALGADAVTEAKIADSAIESEHLNNNIISGTTALTSAPDDTDEFLVSDAGTLKRIDYSLIKGGGIEVADNWRLSANYTIDSSETDLDSNWERVDTTGQGFIGTAMSQSSGLFTFPSTGIYFISFDIQYYGADNNDYGRAVIVHNNGSGTKTHLTDNRAHYQDQERIAIHAQCIFDCQNTSTDKIEFFGGGNRSSTVSGSTNKHETNGGFIRLGDT